MAQPQSGLLDGGKGTWLGPAGEGGVIQPQPGPMERNDGHINGHSSPTAKFPAQ